MSTNPNAVYDREDEARSAMLRAWGINVTKPSAEVVSLDTKRRPLGLSIVDGPDDASIDGLSDAYLGPQRTAAAIVARSIANLSEEQLAAAVTWRDMFEYAIGGTIETSFTDGDFLREKVRELRKEATDAQTVLREQIAELKLAVVEARCEISAMRAIQENARTVSRGEAGVAGPRGIPGSQGPTGPRGEMGERGVPAVAIAGWEPRPERFEVVPVFSTGERGPPIALLSLFQAYDSAVSDIEDRDIVSAAEASREANEAEAENAWSRR